MVIHPSLGISFSSCSNSKKSDETNAAQQDTTPIGKRIADISIKIGKDPKNAQLFNDRALLHLERNDVANALMDMEKERQALLLNMQDLLLKAY